MLIVPLGPLAISLGCFPLHFPMPPHLSQVLIFSFYPTALSSLSKSLPFMLIVSQWHSCLPPTDSTLFAPPLSWLTIFCFSTEGSPENKCTKTTKTNKSFYHIYLFLTHFHKFHGCNEIPEVSTEFCSPWGVERVGGWKRSVLRV